MSTPDELVIVTGSTGFVGQRLLEKLAPDFKVVGLDIAEPESLPDNCSYQSIDLTDAEAVRGTIGSIAEEHGKRIASVIHLAAYFDLTGEPDPKYQEVTVKGSERLLEALKPYEVEQFVFSSTMLVHAPGKPGDKIDETWPLDPKLPYRASKIETEELLKAKHGAIPLVLLRAAGVYDDGCSSPFLANQIARILERSPKSNVYPGDPQTAQAWLHVDDLAEGVLRLVQRRRELPEELPLLLGEPDAMPYEALQRRIGQLAHGEDWPTWQVPKALAKSGAWLEDKVMGEDTFVQPWMIDAADDDYTLDISRAKELLDWQPQQTLYDRLPQMIDRLKRDPEAWYRRNGLDPSRLKTARQPTTTG